MKPQNPVAGSRPEPVRVLIVDDSEDVLFILGRELELLGYIISVATNADDALRVAGTFHPHVIVSDIGLPGTDGFELLKWIRQNVDLASAPVIAVTGFGLQEDAAQMRTYGFDGHLVKPVDGASVSAAIQTAIGNSRRF